MSGQPDITTGSQAMLIVLTWVRPHSSRPETSERLLREYFRSAGKSEFAMVSKFGLSAGKSEFAMVSKFGLNQPNPKNLAGPNRT